jgi:Helix-turn-helix domain
VGIGAIGEVPMLRNVLAGFRRILTSIAGNSIGPKQAKHGGECVGRWRTRDSVRVMADVWELRLAESHKFILLGFADHANDEGFCFPSISRIAWKCGLSDRQVQRVVAALRDAGLLVPVKNLAGGRNRSTVYRVCPEKGDKLSPFISARGDALSAERVTSATQKDDASVTRIIKNHQESGAVRKEGAKHTEAKAENAGQLSRLLKESAEKRTASVPSWVRDSLTESLYRGIHSQAIARAFFDSRKLTPREQLAECVNVGVTSIATARVATLKPLDAKEIEKIALHELAAGLEALCLMKDFEARQRHTVQTVVRVIVQVCVRMLREKAA